MHSRAAQFRLFNAGHNRVLTSTVAAAQRMMKNARGKPKSTLNANQSKMYSSSTQAMCVKTTVARSSNFSQRKRCVEIWYLQRVCVCFDN